MSLLKFKQLNKLFLPSNDGLVDINLSFNQGSFSLLKGKSGAGKTTILKLITQEYLPSSGEIWFNNTKVGKLKGKNLEQHRRKIGVIYQDYKLILDLNIWENVAMPLIISGNTKTDIARKVTDLLDLIGLHNKALLFPKQLSGGEAQRVSIARALALDPLLVFADEPTGNLDEETANAIGLLLKKINAGGTTIIIATHDENILNLFQDSRLILIESGKIIKDTKSPLKIKKSTKINKS